METKYGNKTEIWEKKTSNVEENPPKSGKNLKIWITGVSIVHIGWQIYKALDMKKYLLNANYKIINHAFSKHMFMMWGNHKIVNICAKS